MANIYIKNKNHSNSYGEYIGRGSPLGNPFKISGNRTRNIAILEFGVWIKESILNKKEYFFKQEDTINELTRLFNILIKEQELNLICYCSPKLCHGNIIKQLLLNKYYHGTWLVNDEIGIIGL